MNAILEKWNAAPEHEAINDLLTCCGSRRWAAAVVAQRPYVRLMEMRVAADMAWATMNESDLLEAFAQADEESHYGHTSIQPADGEIRAKLAEANQRYRERFGFPCIICPTEKSGAEMLSIVNDRLNGQRDTELREAAEQQRQFMQVRISNWLGI